MQKNFVPHRGGQKSTFWGTKSISKFRARVFILLVKLLLHQNLIINSQVYVYDNLGKQVLQSTNYSNNFSLYFTASAMYYCKIVLSNGEVINRKVVVEYSKEGTSETLAPAGGLFN